MKKLMALAGLMLVVSGQLEAAAVRLKKYQENPTKPHGITYAKALAQEHKEEAGATWRRRFQREDVEALQARRDVLLAKVNETNSRVNALVDKKGEPLTISANLGAYNAAMNKEITRLDKVIAKKRPVVESDLQSPLPAARGEGSGFSRGWAATTRAAGAVKQAITPGVKARALVQRVGAEARATLDAHANMVSAGWRQAQRAGTALRNSAPVRRMVAAGSRAKQAAQRRMQQLRQKTRSGRQNYIQGTKQTEAYRKQLAGVQKQIDQLNEKVGQSDEIVLAEDDQKRMDALRAEKYRLETMFLGRISKQSGPARVIPAVDPNDVDLTPMQDHAVEATALQHASGF